MVLNINKHKKLYDHMSELTLNETFQAIGQVITNPESIFKTIHKQGKKFLPAAMIFIVIVELFGFFKGFNINTILKFISGIISPFVFVLLVVTLGRMMFNGKAEFWGLFCSMGFIRVALIFLPLVLIGVFNYILLAFLTLFFLIYVFVLSITAISTCHKITPVKSFIIMLLSVAIIGSLELALVYYLGIPSDNIVGEAISLAF
jgi:hypothetical protein